jgi:hypothetical protein
MIGTRRRILNMSIEQNLSILNLMFMYWLPQLYRKIVSYTPSEFEILAGFYHNPRLGEYYKSLSLLVPLATHEENVDYCARIDFYLFCDFIGF